MQRRGTCMEYTASRDKSSYTFLFGQNPEDRSSCYHCVQLFVRTVNILEKRECKYSHTHCEKTRNSLPLKKFVKSTI